MEAHQPERSLFSSNRETLPTAEWHVSAEPTERSAPGHPVPNVKKRLERRQTYDEEVLKRSRWSNDEENYRSAWAPDLNSWMFHQVHFSVSNWAGLFYQRDIFQQSRSCFVVMIQPAEFHVQNCLWDFYSTEITPAYLDALLQNHKPPPHTTSTASYTSSDHLKHILQLRICPSLQTGSCSQTVKSGKSGGSTILIHMKLIPEGRGWTSRTPRLQTSRLSAGLFSVNEQEEASWYWEL